MKKNTETEKARKKLQNQIRRIEKNGFIVDETLKQISKKGNIRQLNKIDEDLILRRSTISIDGKKMTGKEIISELKEKGLSVLEINKLLQKSEVEKIKKIKDIKIEKIEQALDERLTVLEDRAKSKNQKAEEKRLRDITSSDIKKAAKDIQKNIASQILVNNEINEMSQKILKGEASFGGAGAFEKLKKGAKKYDTKRIERMNKTYKDNFLKGIREQIARTNGKEREKWEELEKKIKGMGATEVYLKLEKNGEVSKESRKTVFSYNDPLISIIDSENSANEILEAISE